MLNLVDFTGKKIIVAGASSGIGKCTALTLARYGAQVIMIARRKDKLEETLQEIREYTDGKGGVYYPADLSEVDGIAELVKRIADANGAVDGLVYCAGVGGARPMAQYSYDKLLETMNINYFGFVETVRQVTKKGRYNRGMRIVGISSVAALFGDGGHLAYSGSKAAMNGSARCMAYELAAKGIALNTIAPSMVKTEMFGHYLANYGEDSESYRDLIARQYLGLAEVQDAANLIAFLASSASDGITGACIPIDGGYSTFLF
ncbi:MAG: SDR family oxidoreductase [Synergistaceae bacterium]|nr:SDR family oxidoreductase [Synergistaceae bacterium]